MTKTVDIEAELKELRELGRAGSDSQERQIEEIVGRIEYAIRAAPEPNALHKEVGDGVECALRVEIASDTNEKVETFRQQLCDAILAAPAALRADVMVTIHGMDDPLPVFETNRSSSKSDAMQCPKCGASHPPASTGWYHQCAVRT